MYSFRNDYMEGAHPRVLDAIVAMNMEQTPGYTDDAICARARTAIRSAITRSDAAGALRKANVAAASLEVEFVAGGTMANLLVMAAGLRPHECVIAAADGHINVHETGAIEACGHKVLTTADADGLLSVAGIDAVMKAHLGGTNYHMVKPRMVYLSLATEMGLSFNLKRLKDIFSYTRAHDLLLYIDGARLACGLAAEGCDITLADLCAYSDAFSIGGTKNGALFGEALVIRNPELQRDFRYIMKQKGAVMAKGRVLGVQFDALFSTADVSADVPEAHDGDSLFMALGRHSVAMAKELKRVLEEAGYTSFASDSNTNQQFLLLENDLAKDFVRAFDADEIAYPDDSRTIVRMTCRWSTQPEHIDFVRRVLAGEDARQ